jgi:cobalt-zinc-cadmium efflux system protein
MADRCYLPQGRPSLASDQRRLRWVLGFSVAYLVAEVIGGVLTGSLALLSDAGHMLADVGALALALFALVIATRPATPRRTFGYYRVEILAALFNGIALLGLAGFILFEAVERIRDPQPVQATGMLLVAIGGLVVNLAGAYLLHAGHAHSLNVRAAFYHVLGDALGSLGAIIAAILILSFGWMTADPIIAILIAVLVIISAVRLVREAADILLEATPRHLDTEALRGELLAIRGVVGVHDFHIWTITSGIYSLSCHVVVEPAAFTAEKLEEVRLVLHDECAIPHQTIQLETPEFAAREDVHV